MVEIMTILVLLGLLAHQIPNYLNARRSRQAVEAAWGYRLRVAEIESQITQSAPESEAADFVRFLADLCSSADFLMSLHKTAIKLSRISNEAHNIHKQLQDMVDSEHLALVEEALTETACAAYMLGTTSSDCSPEQNEAVTAEAAFVIKASSRPNFIQQLAV